MTEPSETEPSETARPGTEPVAAAESAPGPVRLPGLETSEPLPETPDAAAIAAPLEALLLMATEPLPAAELAQAVRAPVEVVERALAELARCYDETARGFELRNVGGGWRYWTRAEHADLIGAWLVEGQHARLSQAALETLAVVAYLQPISRGRVSAVRGVNVDGVLRTLVTRDLVQEVDRDAETGAMLFGTTGHFLERLGLSGLDDLPPIAPLLPDAAALEAELRASTGAAIPSVDDSTPLVAPAEASEAVLPDGAPPGSADEVATGSSNDSTDEETTR